MGNRESFALLLRLLMEISIKSNRKARHLRQLLWKIGYASHQSQLAKNIVSPTVPSEEHFVS